MALNGFTPLLTLTVRASPVRSGVRYLGGYQYGSRINKYKRPFVGGIYKKIQKPIRPREKEDFAAEGESLYPEIIGEYPPGEWGKMEVERAWKFHARSEELLKIGSLRERLYDLTKKLKAWTEKVESKEKMKYWSLEPSLERPYFFPFVQYVTKTRLHLSLPKEMLRPNSKINIASLKRRINDKVRLMDAVGASPEMRVAEIVETVQSELLASQRLEHLVEGQLEEDVKFEAGWRRGGFAEDDMENEIPKRKIWEHKGGWYKPDGGYDHADPGIINFQGRGEAFLALRSRFPLQDLSPEDVGDFEASKSSKVVSGDSSTDLTGTQALTQDASASPFVHDWVVYDDNSIPLYAYHPSLHGLQNFIDPPSFDPGYRLPPVTSRNFVTAHRDKFWIEKPHTWNAISDRNKLRREYKHHTIDYHPGVESDPRGFPHTAFLLPTTEKGIEALGYDSGDAYQLQQWDADRMLTTLFTWNVASAHFQGFCSYLDLAYPLASQGVMTDGRSWQFYILRTDSIELWRDDDAFLKGNTMWMTRKLTMDEDADLIIAILSNVLAKETRTDMSQEQLQPFVTKSDEIELVEKPKYDFEMKVL